MWMMLLWYWLWYVLLAHCYFYCADNTRVQTTSIGSGVSVSVQTANGLGRDSALLTESQVVAYQKVSIGLWHRVNMPTNYYTLRP
jgi:hypothetical protein